MTLNVLLKTSFKWFVELDKVLSYTLFATLAGLALAAAAFLSGVLGEARARLKLLNKEISEHCGKIDFEVRKPGEDWLKQYCTDNGTYPSIEIIEAQRFNSEIAVYLQCISKSQRVKHEPDEVSKSRYDILASFVIFLIGLIEAVTLDPFAEASVGVAETQSTYIGYVIALFLSKGLVIADTVIAASLLLGGLWYFCNGVRHFLKNRPYPKHSLK